MTRFICKLIDVIIFIFFSLQTENSANFPFVKGHLQFFTEYSDTVFGRGVALRQSNAHNNFQVGCWKFQGFTTGVLCGLLLGVPGTVQLWVKVAAIWQLLSDLGEVSQWHQTRSVPISSLQLVLIGATVGSRGGVTESKHQIGLLVWCALARVSWKTFFFSQFSQRNCLFWLSRR